MRIRGLGTLLLCILLSSQARAQEISISGVSVDNSGRIRVQIESSAANYYGLFVRPDHQTGDEWLVSLTPGQEGSTILTEPLAAFSADNYRVVQYANSSPADSDGDGIDDLQEIQDLGTLSPLNSAFAIAINDGAAAIPDRSLFETLSYQGLDVLIDVHLTNLEFVKFHLLGMDTDQPSVYFMNTDTHRAHRRFANTIGIPNAGAGQMRGEIVYHADIVAASGVTGVYRFEFEPNDSYSFELVQAAYEVLAANMTVLENNLAYYPMPAAALPLYQTEKALYDASRVSILLDEHIASGMQGTADVDPNDEPQVDTPGYAALNVAEGYGLLKVMKLEDRPNSRDIVIYEALPNELSRVGGIITTVAQTPLSHVNLRAIQDNVPNAYIEDALENQVIVDLVGKYVYYRVTIDGYEIGEATLAEVEAHYAESRPTESQTPERDLSVTAITALDNIGFQDWSAFGVKAANLATLRTLGFPSGTVPDGFAVPFYFYDEFMQFNGFYDDVAAMLADSAFLADYNLQDETLDAFRSTIKDAEMPLWMMDALTDVQNAFPAGTSIRCRSSTNNEDLPGFSGAGLYDSRTQHPDEGHLSKCIKQVFASTWNFRAFDERQFYRIDQFSTAMGVLLHPNYSDELANGVGVTTDPIYQTIDTYYLNTQIGEDLVTNPDALSIPEEMILVSPANTGGEDFVVRFSNLVANGERIMSDQQIDQLRAHLYTIETEFRILYDAAGDEDFAMEIEFKITSENILAIKQARPWIVSYITDASSDGGSDSQALVADAGFDQVYVDTNSVDGEPVTLSGSSSGGLAGNIISYEWFDASGNDFLGQGPLLLIYAADGERQYLLRTSDGQGNSSEDFVTVSVEAPEFNRRYYGVEPNTSLNLSTNNVDSYDTNTQTAYLCVGIYTDDVLTIDQQGTEVYYNVVMQMISADPIVFQIINAIALSAEDLINAETGEAIDCAGKFDTATAQYTNYIQAGDDIGLLTLGLISQEALTFSVLGYTPVDSQ